MLFTYQVINQPEEVQTFDEPAELTPKIQTSFNYQRARPLETWKLTDGLMYCNKINYPVNPENLKLDRYIPSTAESKEYLDKYSAWCTKYKQPQYSELLQDLSGDVEYNRAALLEWLEAKSSAFENNLNKDMYFTSSLGFRCNGDRRTKDNLQDLITFFDYQSQDGKIQYRDFDNIERELTKEQVQTLLGEHVANSQNLYQQKWAYEQQINTCETLDQLHEIKIEFVMKDYTQS